MEHTVVALGAFRRRAAYRVVQPRGGDLRPDGYLAGATPEQTRKADQGIDVVTCSVRIVLIPTQRLEGAVVVVRVRGVLLDERVDGSSVSAEALLEHRSERSAADGPFFVEIEGGPCRGAIRFVGRAGPFDQHVDDRAAIPAGSRPLYLSGIHLVHVAQERMF